MAGLRGYVAVLLLGASVLVTRPASAQSFNERPASVIVLMTNSRTIDGTYQLAEVARVCGEVPKERSFAGVPAFSVLLYPESGDAPVMDVTFGSTALVGGVTTTGQFQLSVIVRSPKIGRPPAYVLDTAQPKMKGVATLTTPSKGSIMLTVTGTNDLGEAIDLKVTCGPRATK